METSLIFISLILFGTLLYLKPWKASLFYFILFCMLVLFSIFFFFENKLGTIEFTINKIGFMLMSSLFLLNLRFDYRLKDYLSFFISSNSSIKGNIFLIRILTLSTLVFIVIKVYYYGV